MPLIQPTLQQSLSSIFSAPSNQPQGTRVAQAIINYFTPITPPSTGVAAFSPAFLGSISSRGTSPSNVRYIIPDFLSTELPKFANAIALGMAPAFTGIVPIAPLPNFRALFDSLTNARASATQCASVLAAAIHNWAISGLAVNNISGVTIPWGAPVPVAPPVVTPIPNLVSYEISSDIANSYRQEALQARAEAEQLQVTNQAGAVTAFEYSQKRFSEIGTGTVQSATAPINVEQVIDNTPTELKSDIGLRIIQIASTDIGILETGTPPGLNYGGFPGGQQLQEPGRIDEMLSSCGLDNQAKVASDGSGYYWCAAAVMQWYKEAGALTPPSGQASCDTWKNWGISNGLFRQNPVIGAAVLYGTLADSNHIGVVSGITPDGQITTIEGNTSGGGFNRNGVGVFSKIPNQSKIIGYVHPRSISQ